MTELTERGPELDKLLLLVLKEGGSGLFLEPGLSPVLQVAGASRAVEMCPLTGANLEELVDPLLTEARRRLLADRGAVDFAHVERRTGTEFHITLTRAAGRFCVAAERL